MLQHTNVLIARHVKIGQFEGANSLIFHQSSQLDIGVVT